MIESAYFINELIGIVFILPPTWQDLTQGHFLESNSQIKNHARQEQKILDLVGTPLFGAPKAPSHELSSA